MSTLQTDEPNILDAETINWRLIVYPILVAVIIFAGGLSYYYYQQSQRDQAEDTARAALIQAKTPADLAKVADQYPGTDQAVLALLSAGNGSFVKHDYASAITYYQRVLGIADVNADLHASAQLGLASALEASGKADDAINAYLEVARLGDKSPYAPYAYSTVAGLYQQRGDKAKQQEILTEAASLDPDSEFVKQMQMQLKQLSAQSAPPMTVPLPASATPGGQPAAPIGAAPTPATPGSPAPQPVVLTPAATPATAPVPPTPATPAGK